MEYRITCIQKAVTEDSVMVTDVGGIDAQGERWTMSVESKRLLRLPSCP